MFFIVVECCVCLVVCCFTFVVLFLRVLNMFSYIWNEMNTTYWFPLKLLWLYCFLLELLISFNIAWTRKLMIRMNSLMFKENIWFEYKLMMFFVFVFDCIVFCYNCWFHFSSLTTTRIRNKRDLIVLYCCLRNSWFAYMHCVSYEHISCAFHICLFCGEAIFFPELHLADSMQMMMCLCN